MEDLLSCTKCPRLREHCHQIGKIKRKAYVDQTYWAKPVPPLGDPHALLWIVGLAPGAHGANRTGRMITGDSSGHWLFRALFDHGFSNQAQSTGPGDGLKLFETYITTIVKCAPPQNLPSPSEINHCTSFLEAEWNYAHKKPRVYLALGSLAHQKILKILTKNLFLPTKLDSKKTKFTHGNCLEFTDGSVLLSSYHPSQQNTFTKRLTLKMWDEIFQKAKRSTDQISKNCLQL